MSLLDKMKISFGGSKMLKNEKKRIETLLVAICSFVYFVSYFSRKSFAAVMAGMISESVIDKVDGGFIGMGLFICYGAGQLISGYLGDKIRPRYLIILGVGTTCLCNLLMPLVTSPALMIVAWSVNGLAQAMLWPPIVKLLSENLNGEAFVRANLVVTSAAHVATILLYLFVPVCLEFFEWETVFFTASALALLSLPVFAIIMKLAVSGGVKDGVEDNSGKRVAQKGDGFGALLVKSGIIPVFLCIIMMGFLRDGIESWLPTLYSEAFKRDASESTLISVALPIFSIVMVSVTTAIHKKRFFANEVRSSLIFFVACALAGVPLYFIIGLDAAWARVLSLVLTMLISGAMHGCNFMLISCLPGRFAKVHRSATTSGLCNAFVYIGAALSMYGIASIAENLGWGATILSWIIIAVIGAIFCVLALRSYSGFLNEK